MTRIEDTEETEVISPGLVSRLERVLGVNTGERVRIVIPRSQIQTGIGESPETCLFTLDLCVDLYHITHYRSPIAECQEVTQTVRERKPLGVSTVPISASLM